MGVNLPVTEDLSVLSTPCRFAGRTVPNRFVVHPMEGFDSDAAGAPGELAFRRYRRYAEGGVSVIWAEATAVLWEARSNPGQLWIHDGNVDAFAQMVAQARKAGHEANGFEPVFILQLTHSGRYSKPTGVPEPIIAHHSAVLDSKHNLPSDYPLVTDEYLDRLQDAFVHAAKLAARAGFDGVDVKGCHRYLAAELHASFTREGRYGGSFENRTRLLRESLTRIRDEVSSLFVTTRLNVYDAIDYPYGFGVSEEDYRIPDLSEPIRFIGDLKNVGIPLLNISIGNPYFNPHFGRPYDLPVAGAKPPPEHPLVGVARFLKITKEVQEAHPDLPVIGSGYTWLRQFMPNVAAAVLQTGGATLIGQGRGAFAYPDSVNDICKKGALDPRKVCVTCSCCTQIMRDGAKTGCVVRDNEIYGEQYRLGRRFALDRLQEEARRCRECLEPTCADGCPARIDIPGFVRAFADGDFATSYNILRARNVLPEMCGFICPAAEQCQAGCVEEHICKNPIPIQDIQLVVSKTARRMGITGVRMPEASTGKRVVVIGGGPCGLACAIQLLEKGHSVVIMEKGKRLGGTPDDTIPGARYTDSEAEVEAVLKPALEAGRAEVCLETVLGVDVHLEDLTSEYDAVFLAVGLGKCTSIGEAEGVYGAMAFLKAVKSGVLTELPGKIAVLGAGNTAMDAASTARRLGSPDVYLVYRRSFAEMPAWKEERDVFLDMGGHILLLTQPIGYETDDAGKLIGLRVAHTELGEPDASGRRRPVVVPDSEFILPVSMAVEAMGLGLADSLKQAMTGVALTDRGLVQVDCQFATSVPGVYAAGDLVNGGTTAVQGIAEGMAAALSINSTLS